MLNIPYPKKLTSQIIFVILLVIIFSQLIGFFTFSNERRIALQVSTHRQIMFNINSIFKTLIEVPSEYHENIIREISNNDAYHISIDSTPIAKVHDYNKEEVKIKRHLEGLLDAEGLNVVFFDDHEGLFHWWRWSSWKQQVYHYLFGEKMPRLKSPGHHSHERYTFHGLQPEFTVSIKLPSNGWLNIKSFVAPTSILLGLPSIMTMLITGGLLISAAIFMTRRVTRPLASLAFAASRFGRGEIVEKIELFGPQDVQEAVRAFNNMQEKIDNFVKDRTQMLAAISHDLRTPITSLRLRSEFIENSSLKAMFIATLVEMENMTESILSFSKKDFHKEESCNINLYVLLDSIITDFVELKKEAHIEGIKDIIIRCRPISFKRALLNCIENSIKYSGEVYVSLTSIEEVAIITIQDNGLGIPDEYIDNVFEPFFKADQSRGSSGVGLGLSIARTIVCEHGGNISIKNKDDFGIIVTIQIPQVNKN